MSFLGESDIPVRCVQLIPSVLSSIIVPDEETKIKFVQSYNHTVYEVVVVGRFLSIHVAH